MIKVVATGTESATVTVCCGSVGNAATKRSCARSDCGLFVGDDCVVNPVKANASAANEPRRTRPQAANVRPGRRLHARATDVVENPIVHPHGRGTDSYCQSPSAPRLAIIRRFGGHAVDTANWRVHVPPFGLSALSQACASDDRSKITTKGLCSWGNRIRMCSSLELGLARYWRS
jgi:hypothetical protein